MKKLKNEMLKKIMPVFLLIILLFNFVMPNYVYADVWEDVGGVLFKPIKSLTRGIADAVLYFLQNNFVTKGTGIKVDGIYYIRYSPGVIFQGKVPGLDINFIGNEEKTDVYQYQLEWVHEKETEEYRITEDIGIEEAVNDLIESANFLNIDDFWNTYSWEMIPIDDVLTVLFEVDGQQYAVRRHVYTDAGATIWYALSPFYSIGKLAYRFFCRWNRWTI